MVTNTVYRHLMSEDNNDKRQQATGECQEGIYVGEQRLRIEKISSIMHLELNTTHKPSSKQTPGTSPGRQGGHDLLETIDLALLSMTSCM